MLSVLYMEKLVFRKVKILGKGYIVCVCRIELKSSSSDYLSSTLSGAFLSATECLKMMMTQVGDHTEVSQLFFLSVLPIYKVIL